MDAQFWIQAWEEGRTGFHQKDYNDKLVKYFPRLNPCETQRVLVPLCGKSRDMLYLSDLKLQVHGVELHEQAVKDFFEENNLSLSKNFNEYTHQNIKISCGDFFRFEGTNFDLVYDRASLIALPDSMRKKYVETITRSMKVGGKCLLIAIEYDQSKMPGPPFSIEEKQIYQLYQEHFSIQLLETVQETNLEPRFACLENTLKQKNYILEKIK